MENKIPVINADLGQIVRGKTGGYYMPKLSETSRSIHFEKSEEVIPDVPDIPLVDGVSSEIKATRTEGGVLIEASDYKGTTSAMLKDGVRGDRGKSAYDIAVENGYIGTEQEWAVYMQANAETAHTAGIEARASADEAAKSKFDTATMLSSAQTAESNAKASETAASNSANEATQSARNAGTSAENAALSETNAGTHETNAKGFSDAAAGSATQAAASATAAGADADRAKGEADRAVLATDGKADKNNAANAIKETLTGSVIATNMVSPIEHKVKCKIFSDTVTDLSKVIVTRCGTQLINPQAVFKTKTNLHAYRPDVPPKYSGFALKAGVPYTVSTNYKTSGLYISTGNEDLTVAYGKSEITYTPPKDVLVSFDLYWANGVPADAYIMLNVGKKAYPYEEYQSATYFPTSDGAVENMKSLSPSMTILTDTAGVNIEATYNADTKKYIDKKFAELQSAIVTNV